MSKQQLVELFFQNAETLTPPRIALILFCSLGASLVIYFVYRLTARFDGYNESFNQGNILLTLLTSIIMMLISTNIAVSLGMVGALSIIRFRTAVKNPRDTLFYFWAIVSGLCIGCQYFVLALISLFFMTMLSLVLYFLRRRSSENHTLILSFYRNQEDFSARAALLAVLDDSSCTYRILATNYSDSCCEMVFALTGTSGSCMDAAENISRIQGIVSVNLVGSENNY